MKVLSRIYRFHFRDERRERLFLASLAFLLTFGIVWLPASVRDLCIALRAARGPIERA